MNKIKIIELLNMISRGEEVPEKIFYSDKIWYWDTKENDYVEDYKRLFNYYLDEISPSSLNEEVEIIEDKSFNERVEEIYNRHIDYIYGKEDKKIEKIPMVNEFESNIVSHNQTRIKINEIIDKLNKEE